MAVIASFTNGSTRTITKTLHQFDKKQKLYIVGIDLPGTYEVHFSNDRDGGMAYAVKGNDYGVMIPDVYLATGEYVFAWVYAKGEEENESEYMITIPVERRPMPLPVQKDGEPGYEYEYVENDQMLIIKPTQNNP